MPCAVWTPLAEVELEEILFYIRVKDRRPETARRIGEEIRTAVDEQAADCAPGHKHPLAPEGWSYLKHKRWLVFFQAHSEGIEVMRIIDGARDIAALLQG